ncbi:redoxin family protein [Chitinophaga rhizosphaerae]|uniref:redoxin family protein n=1 Tax=Chitinophaga rhizosphaerae TaxID=1864947 RepID=UPI000F815332|nr:hypothetical protein [Chitinophaga rhizosphaerae]
MKIPYSIGTSCYFILLISLIAVGCKSNITTKQPDEISAPETKKYSFPKNLLTFQTGTFISEIDSATIMNAPYKLIVSIDFSCPVCIAEVDKWRNFYMENLQQRHVMMVLLCQSTDKYRYMKYLFKNKKLKEFPFPIYLDINNEGLKFNPDLTTATGKVKTVLVDADSKILYMGIPFDREENKKDLIKAIDSIGQVPFAHLNKQK